MGLQLILPTAECEREWCGLVEELDPSVNALNQPLPTEICPNTAHAPLSIKLRDMRVCLKEPYFSR